MQKRNATEDSLFPENFALVQLPDWSAFRTLLDHDDEAFLREMLPWAQFCRHKRLRIRVTWKYVSRIADFSDQALRVCAAATRYRLNVNQAKFLAEAGDLAWQTSVQCIFAFAKLSVEYVFPAIHLRIPLRKPVKRLN